jgi:hypothetical protein
MGAGMAMRFAKAPAGIYDFIGKTNRVSAREGGRPAARRVLWKDPRLLISRSAALSPCPCGNFEALDPLLLFEK